MTETQYKMKNSIVLVPFPFDDFTDLKIRPALCLTNNVGDFEHVIIAFISSKLNSNSLESDFLIESQLKPETGLKVNSIIKLNKIITIPKTLIKRKLGELSAVDCKIINQKIVKLFDLICE